MKEEMVSSNKNSRQSFHILSFILVALLTIPRTLTQSILLVAIPRLSEELHLSALETQMILPIFIASMMLAMLPAGLLGDRLGSRPLLIFSTYVYLIGSFFAGVVGSGHWLMVCLVVMGIASGFSLTQGSAYLTEIYPLAIRGRVIGLYSALISLSFFGGPILGGVMSLMGQKGVFWTMLPFMVFAILASRELPFVQRESTSAKEQETGNLFSFRFLRHCLIALCWQSMLSLIVFFPAEFQIHLGYTPLYAGTLFTLLSLPFPFLSPVSGWLFDQKGYLIAYRIGFSLVGLAWVFSLFSMYYIGVLLLTAGMAFVIPITASASWGFFQQKQRALATSVYYFIRLVGSIIGSLMGGVALFGVAKGDAVFLFTFTVVFVLMLFSLPLALFFRRHP